MNIEHQYKKHIISRTIFKLKYQILYVFGIEKKNNANTKYISI